MQSVLAAHVPLMRRSVVGCLLLVAAGALSGCASDQSASIDQATMRSVAMAQPAAAQEQPVASTTTPADATAAPAATEPATQPAGTFVPPAPARTESPSGPDAFSSGQGVILPGEAPPRIPLTFSATGQYFYGPVNGYAQIPAGGTKGSSTGQAPRFSHVGINNASIFDAELAIGWDDRQQVFVGGQWTNLSGSAHLQKALVSHGVSFPKGTPVSSTMRMDWYRFGYRYQYPLHTAPNGIPDVTLTPWLEGLVWQFGYNLDGGKVGTAERSFNQFGLQLGGTVAWRPNGGPFSIEAYAGSFPSISHWAQISVEGVVARYRFYQWHRADFSVLLGLAFEQQYFKDSQSPLNNMINADFGPMLQTGVQIKF